MGRNTLFAVLIIITIFSSIEAQESITELPQEKNQLFWLLKVKIEKIKQENFKTDDSIKVWKNITKNYYDPRGYLIKKEIFDSSLTLPSVINEYKYDENGNYTEFLHNGNLRKKMEYDSTGKLTRVYSYQNGTILHNTFTEYDAYGNEIEVFTVSSSGKIDTISITNYNYDYAFSPPRIISDTNYFRERDDLEITICEFDSIGRIIKSLTLHQDKIRNDTSFYFYNDKDLFDSTMQFTNEGISKVIRHHDSIYRLTKDILYWDTDSSPYIWNLSYDDKIYNTINSLFHKNDLDLTKISDFEKTGVILETLQKGQDEIRAKIFSEYYPNALIKKKIKTDFDQNRIEETNYEYEFYEK